MPSPHRSLLTLAVTSLLSLAATARIIAIHAADGAFSVVNGAASALPGDVLEFHFLSANHSVVQGNENQPCSPVPSGGFFSGFLPTAQGENGNVFHVAVNDTGPIFFYCAQNEPSNACATGMVGAINASPEALEKYKCDAAAATTAVVPAGTPYGGVVVPLNPATVTYTGTATATPVVGGGGAGAGGGQGTETGTCTTGVGAGGGGGGTGTAPVGTATPSTSAYPGTGGGAGGTGTTANPPASGTGTGTGSGSETPGSGAGDPGATGSDVPTTNGAGRVALWSEGMGVVFAVVMLCGWML